MAANKIGKNQLALLIIIDEATVFDGHGDLVKYATFSDETAIPYTALDGERTDFYIMTRDLKSIDSLVERGLVRRPRNTKLRFAYMVTESGRIEVERLRARAQGGS